MHSSPYHRTEIHEHISIDSTNIVTTNNLFHSLNFTYIIESAMNMSSSQKRIHPEPWVISFPSFQTE